MLVTTAATAPELAPARHARDLHLMLLITVDQFRCDYLTRLADTYTSGWARLLRDGASFVDAHLEHYPTVTTLGHAALGTGAMPATSGIIGNDWFDRGVAKSVTSVSDEQVRQVGGEAATSASPRRLQVTTVADELKLAARARGAQTLPRTIGLSLKDRSASCLSVTRRMGRSGATAAVATSSRVRTTPTHFPPGFRSSTIGVMWVWRYASQTAPTNVAAARSLGGATPEPRRARVVVARGLRRRAIQRAMAGNARRQRRQLWQRRQRGFCQLQNLQEVIGFESHLARRPYAAPPAVPRTPRSHLFWPTERGG
jgi:hypothetical protein